LADTQDRDDPESDPLRRCPQCRELISALARKCPRCSSILSWRQHLQLSSTVLALLVALISVVSWAALGLKDAFVPKNSSFQASVLGAEGAELVLAVSNSGARGGWLERASIHLESHGWRFEIPLRSNSRFFDSSIRGDSTTEVRLAMEFKLFEPIPDDWPQNEEMRKHLVESRERLVGALDGRPPPDSCFATVIFKNFDGSRTSFDLELLPRREKAGMGEYFSTDCFRFFQGAG
jgi:hypothetical protein